MQNNLVSLGDTGLNAATTCTSGGVFSEYDQCACWVWAMANYYAEEKVFGLIPRHPCRGLITFNPLQGIASPSCYEMAEIKKVINTYQNLVLSKNASVQIPIYDRKNNINAIEKIEKSVSEHSGIHLPRVQTILWWLYKVTNDGYLKSNVCLNPLNAEANKNIQAFPPGSGGWEGTLNRTIQDFGEAFKISWDIAKWVVPVLLLGGVAVGGLYLYRMVPKKQIIPGAK